MLTTTFRSSALSICKRSSHLSLLMVYSAPLYLFYVTATLIACGPEEGLEYIDWKRLGGGWCSVFGTLGKLSSLLSRAFWAGAFWEGAILTLVGNPHLCSVVKANKVGSSTLMESALVCHWDLQRKGRLWFCVPREGILPTLRLAAH